MNDISLVLITGSSGALGSRAARAVAAAGYRLRLLDLVAPADPPPGAELVPGSVTDPALLARTCEGVGAVLHYGGLPNEDRWEEILAVNVDGTQKVLQAAAQAGAAKVMLASSNHAVGNWSREEAPAEGLPADALPRPDTFYGVSKAAMEALGSLYHHRFGLDVLTVRIGTCVEDPEGERSLSTWWSGADHDALLLAWLAEPGPAAYRLVWGISDNRRGWFDLSGSDVGGYRPGDDAERDLPDLAAAHPDPGPTPGQGPTRLGGSFTSVPLGEPMPR